MKIRIVLSLAIVATLGYIYRWQIADQIVSRLPDQTVLGQTHCKFHNEFVEIYYHPKHGAFACYFNPNDSKWYDLNTGYEI
jgi:hypothetical protein